MKERLYVIIAAVALLVTLMLPVLSSPLSVGRAGSQRTSCEQVARRGADAMCQSGHACGG